MNTLGLDIIERSLYLIYFRAKAPFCEVVVISLDMSSYGEIFLRGNTVDERPAMSLFR